MRLALVPLVGLIALAGCEMSTGSSLTAVQDLPDDVRTELDAVWRDFEVSIGDRRDCIDDVSIVLVDSVSGGDARYRVGDRTIELAIPTSPRRFRESVAHELGHHIEHSCASFGELQIALGEQWGIDVDAWFDGPDWVDTPSEWFAELVAEVVTGDRVRWADEVPIDDDAVQAFERWATS